MAEDGLNKAKIAPEQADTLLQQTTDALKNLKVSIEQKANGVDLNKKINDAASAMNTAKEHVMNATGTAAQQLKIELSLLPETLRQLPVEVQKTAADNIQQLEKTSSSVWEKIGGGKALNFAKTTIASAMENSGLNTALTKIGDVMGKVGEFANGLWEALKPHLSRLAETPGIAFMLGEKNLKNLQNWLGYDGDTVSIQQAFRSRLGKNVSFTITTKKEAQLFKDVRTDMLKKNGKKESEYTFDMFTQELMKTAELEPFTNDASTAKELPMTTVLSAAKKLVEKTPQATPAPTTPATPEPSKA